MARSNYYKNSETLKGLNSKKPLKLRFVPLNSERSMTPEDNLFEFFLAATYSKRGKHKPSLREDTNKTSDSDHKANLFSKLGLSSCNIML